MLFNLFKKKKDETDVGGVKVRTGAPTTPTPRPAPQRSSFSNQTNNSTNLLSNRLINNQNLISGQQNYQAPKGLTPGLDSITGKTMTQRMDNTAKQSEKQLLRPQQVQEKQQFQPPQAPKFDPMGRYQQLGQDRRALLNQRKQQGENYLNEAYGERQRYLQDYIPRLQQQFAQAKTGVEEGIGLAEGDAAMARDRAEDDWGTAQRQAAMTRRESEARTAGKFAGLNTSDSYGFGSHGQAQENIESDFNRFTQEGIKQKQQNFHEIERALQDYTLQARQQINQMESSLNEAIMQIESDMNMNDIEKRNAISQLATDYQDGVLAIQENLQDIQYQYEMAQQEMAKTQLSPEFMQTGVPQNENDYMFYMKNYDTYKDMMGGGEKPDQKLTEKQQSYVSAANIAQQALDRLASGSANTGYFQGKLGGLGETLGTNSKSQQAYRSDIAAMRTMIQNALLGANMSPQEMQQIMSAIPQDTDAKNIAIAKLEALIRNLPMMAGQTQYQQQQIDPNQFLTNS